MTIVIMPGTYPVALLAEQERTELVAMLRGLLPAGEDAHDHADLVTDVAERVASSPGWKERNKGSARISFPYLLPIGSKEAQVEFAFDLVLP